MDKGVVHKKPNPAVLIGGVVLILLICGITGYFLMGSGDQYYYYIDFDKTYVQSNLSDFKTKFKDDVKTLLNDDDVEIEDITILDDSVLKNKDNNYALYFKINDGDYLDKKVTDNIISGTPFPTSDMNVDTINSHEGPSSSSDCGDYDESNCSSDQVKRDHPSTFICAGDDCVKEECCVDGTPDVVDCVLGPEKVPADCTTGCGTLTQTIATPASGGGTACGTLGTHDCLPGEGDCAFSLAPTPPTCVSAQILSQESVGICNISFDTASCSDNDKSAWDNALMVCNMDGHSVTNAPACIRDQFIAADVGSHICDLNPINTDNCTQQVRHSIQTGMAVVCGAGTGTGGVEQGPTTCVGFDCADSSNTLRADFANYECGQTPCNQDECCNVDPVEGAACIATFSAPNNGHLGDLCSGGHIAHGSSCDMTCDNGFFLTAQPTCADGVITPATATCTACNRPTYADPTAPLTCTTAIDSTATSCIGGRTGPSCGITPPNVMVAALAMGLNSACASPRPFPVHEFSAFFENQKSINNTTQCNVAGYGPRSGDSGICNGLPDINNTSEFQLIKTQFSMTDPLLHAKMCNCYAPTCNTPGPVVGSPGQDTATLIAPQATTCNSNQFVSNGQCSDCPTGTTRSGGDLITGGNTSCETQDACADMNVPCQNGGTCHSTQSSEDGHSVFSCICVGGYTGQACQDGPDVTACGVGMEPHNGVCMACPAQTFNTGTAQEMCQPLHICNPGDTVDPAWVDNGTTDRFCRNNPCDPNPCHNGGTCSVSEVNNLSHCICVDGYTGDTCEIEPPSEDITGMCAGNTDAPTTFDCSLTGKQLIRDASTTTAVGETACCEQRSINCHTDPVGSRCGYDEVCSLNGPGTFACGPAEDLRTQCNAVRAGSPLVATEVEAWKKNVKKCCYPGGLEENEQDGNDDVDLTNVPDNCNGTWNSCKTMFEQGYQIMNPTASPGGEATADFDSLVPLCVAHEGFNNMKEGFNNMNNTHQNLLFVLLLIFVIICLFKDKI
jgi:hypothetical protein